MGPILKEKNARLLQESSPNVVSRTPKKTNLLSPEEIQQKFSQSLNESKQIISSVHDKAVNKFAEVHGMIQNAIHKRASESQAESPDSNPNSRNLDRYNQTYGRDQPQSTHRNELHSGEMKEPVSHEHSHLNGRHHETNQRKNGHQIGHPRGQEQSYQNHNKHQQSDTEKYETPYSGSNTSHVSSQPGFLSEDATKDIAHQNALRKSPSTTNQEKKRSNKKRSNKTDKHAEIHGPYHDKHTDIQNLHYSTDRGYFYEFPGHPPPGESKSLKKPDAYEDFKTRLNMTATTYPHEREAQEFIQQTTKKQDVHPIHPKFRGKKHSSPAKQASTTIADGKHQSGKTNKSMGANSEQSKSTTPSPNRKALEGSNKPLEKMGSTIGENQKKPDVKVSSND